MTSNENKVRKLNMEVSIPMLEVQGLHQPDEGLNPSWASELEVQVQVVLQKEQWQQVCLVLYQKDDAEK